MKKSLLIIIILVIIIVIGFLAVKFLGGGLSSPMGGKSMIDMAREQGEQVPSKKEAISECEKTSDQESKDFCYNMIAHSYRDVSLCKRIKDSEIKKGCTKEKIEEYYKLLEKGEGSIIPGMQGIPGVLEGQNGETGNTGGPAITGEMNDDIFIEIFARTTYLSQLAVTDPVAAEKLDERVTDLYQEFGITQEEFDAYSAKLDKETEANPTKGMQLMQRMNQRIAELQRTGL